MRDSAKTPAAFTGKVCVVTGAGSGIGRALALNLAVHGARLAISDIDREAVGETARLAAQVGAEVEAYVLDVADREAVFDHAEQVRQRFGNANLVINNAGVAVGADVKDISYEDFEWIMGINFWGVVHGTKAFLPQLIASGDGHLVNLSSVFGIIAVPSQGSYNAAKFAVRGFTEALRQEMLVDGAPVTVSCVHPGGVKTNIARNARMTGDQLPGGEEAAEAFEKIARTTPAQAAAVILRGAARGRPKILVGVDAHMIDWTQRLTGAGYEQLIARSTRLAQRLSERR
jgi:NAD(P)-dependent dehydrogenase (short-subunit alcohol dehydrogenase family)